MEYILQDKNKQCCSLLYFLQRELGVKKAYLLIADIYITDGGPYANHK